MDRLPKLLLYTLVFVGLCLGHTAAESNSGVKEKEFLRNSGVFSAKELKLKLPKEHLTTVEQLDRLLRQAGVEAPVFNVRNNSNNPSISGFSAKRIQSIENYRRFNINLYHAFHDYGVGLEWAVLINQRKKESKTIITGVRKASAAEKAGFKEYDEILQVAQGRGLTSKILLRQEQVPNPVPIIVRRGSEEITLMLPLPDITDLPLHFTDPPDAQFSPDAPRVESI